MSSARHPRRLRPIAVTLAAALIGFGAAPALADTPATDVVADQSSGPTDVPAEPATDDAPAEDAPADGAAVEAPTDAVVSPITDAPAAQPEAAPEAAAPAAAADVVNLDILSINDFHGRIAPDFKGKVGGAAVMACTVDEFRAANPNTLFVSAGDNIGASTFVSAVQQDQPTLDVLNAMKLDVSTFGNHEFDKGKDDVNGRVIPASDFPYINANIYTTAGERAYDPYWVTDVDGVTVGFIGAVTEELPSLVSPAGLQGLEVRSMLDNVNQVADQLTDGDATNGEADVVVVLVHDGAATPDLASADGTPYGALIHGVDPSKVSAIISGHTHQAYVHDVDGVWVTQTGSYSQNLGHLTLGYDKAEGKVVSSAATEVALVNADGTPHCAGDPAVAAIVDEAIAVAKEKGTVPVGQISADFLRAAQTDGSENRGGESTIGNFIADAHLWAAQQTNPAVQIAFMNPGGIRTDLTFPTSAANEGDGVVTFEEAALVQPFANTLTTTQLTGAQIVQVLEQQWQPEGSSRPFLKLGVSGLTYTYDPDAPKGEHITGVWFDGAPLEESATYTVAGNSFLIAGGDNFTALTEGTKPVDSGQTDLDAMINWFKANGTATPDYAQRAVGVHWVTDPDAVYAAGQQVTADLSSYLFSRTEPKPTTLSVTLNGVNVGPVPIDPTIVDTTDEVGRATVTFTVPAEALSAEAGEVPLVITDETNGTELTLVVTLAGKEAPPTTTPPTEPTTPPTTVPPTVPPTHGGSTGGGLADTGSEGAGLIALGGIAGLLMLGGLTLARRARAARGQ